MVMELIMNEKYAWVSIIAAMLLCLSIAMKGLLEIL